MAVLRHIIIQRKERAMFFIPVENQIKIAVDDKNPRGKKAVLLIHGWPLSRKMYEYQENLLLCHIGIRRFIDGESVGKPEFIIDIVQLLKFRALNRHTLASPVGSAPRAKPLKTICGASFTS